MNVTVFLPVFEEIDILPWVLKHWRNHGCHVHAIDGWSTDGSYELLKSAMGVSVSRFPESGPALVNHYRRLLKHIEDLALGSDADWCYLSDADEWRRSVVRRETMCQALTRIDGLGHNVLDHKVYSFVCIDDKWSGDPETYFQFYDPNEPIAKLPQEKAWKNDRRVDLHSHGGHLILRPDKRLHPVKFVMKHYPYRTPAQAKAKVETRLARRAQDEYRDGWGVHYDAFPAGFSYKWDPAKLVRF